MCNLSVSVTVNVEHKLTNPSELSVVSDWQKNVKKGVFLCPKFHSWLLCDTLITSFHLFLLLVSYICILCRFLFSICAARITTTDDFCGCWRKHSLPGLWKPQKQKKKTQDRVRHPSAMIPPRCPAVCPSDFLLSPDHCSVSGCF